MYAVANMGHPSREQGLVLCSNYRVPDELHLTPTFSILRKQDHFTLGHAL